jgi:hypothetical protein
VVRVLAVCAAASAAVLVAGPAWACKAVNQPHMIDASTEGIDGTAPTLPPISSVTVTRGKGPQGDGCGGSVVNSCDGRGVIVVGGEATDDMTPPDRIGYLFTIVAGAAPVGFTLPSGAIEPASDGTVSLFWDDQATDDQEPINVTFQVVAIDLAGNQSAPQTFAIQEGTPGKGCRVGPAGGAYRPARPLVALGVAILVAAARRPRRRG